MDRPEIQAALNEHLNATYEFERLVDECADLWEEYKIARDNSYHDVDLYRMRFNQCADEKVAAMHKINALRQAVNELNRQLQENP
jgi:hypothetical protein